MSQFATSDELALHLGSSFDSAERAQADVVLEIVTADIQVWSEQTIAKVTGDVVHLDGRGTEILLLPERPVIQISSLEDDGTTLVEEDDFILDEAAAIVFRLDGHVWTAKRRVVQVTYDHGYEAVPPALKGVCLSAAARRFENPEGATSEQLGSYSVTHGQTAFTEGEAEILARYAKGSV